MTRGLFGWDLPPGVSLSQIPGMRPEDEILEAIAEGWRPRCGQCGRFVPLNADVVTGTDLDRWRTEWAGTLCSAGHITVVEKYPTEDPGTDEDDTPSYRDL